MTETLIETAELRVRLLADEYADMPYNDGGSPLVRVESWPYDSDERVKVEQVTEVTGYVMPGALMQAIHDHLSDEQGDTRNLVHALDDFGVTVVEEYRASGYTYLTLDPLTWRENVGAPEGSVSLEEWKAYCEGEVYGYVVEERVDWVPEHNRNAAYEHMTTWEAVDSCFGYYGYEYAAEAAREAFASEASLRGIEVSA